jgi:hypothetical protein
LPTLSARPHAGAAAIDRYFDYALIPQLFTGNPNAVQTILNMIAASTVTLIGVYGG